MNAEQAFKSFPKQNEVFVVGGEVFLNESDASDYTKHFNLGKPQKVARAEVMPAGVKGTEGKGTEAQGKKAKGAEVKGNEAQGNEAKGNEAQGNEAKVAEAQSDADKVAQDAAGDAAQEGGDKSETLD